jgi:hypothetical protein
MLADFDQNWKSADNPVKFENIKFHENTFTDLELVSTKKQVWKRWWVQFSVVTAVTMKRSISGIWHRSVR